MNILVVDDEKEIADLVELFLKNEGFTVYKFYDSKSAVDCIFSKQIDLALLDVMIDETDGFSILRKIREQNLNFPVIMLTAKVEDSDKILGLSLGADDYITKPFSPKILTARIRAVLRRIAALEEVPEDEKELSRGPLHMNSARRSVTLNGQELDLTCSEFNILYHLAKRPGWVFTRNQIVNAIRGDDYPVTERAIDVQIVGLRRKMGAFGELIETVRGIGYRFSQEP